MNVRSKHIRSLVAHILESHSILSAPVPVEELVAKLGAFLTTTPAEDDLCGFLFREDGNGRAVIGVNSEHHPNRRRFTIAHELGHLLLHTSDEVHVDRQHDHLQLRLRAGHDTGAGSAAEREANLFAAELLIPRNFLEADLREYDGLGFRDENELEAQLKPLAKKYQVSVQALTYRLIDLGYVRSGLVT